MKSISLSFFVIWMILVLGTACAPTRALITQHHGDVVVVHVNKDLSKSDRIERSGTNIGPVEICREFYRHYRDEFDILVLVSNVTQSESENFDPRNYERYTYFKGAMLVLNNQTKGIGKELFDKTTVLDGSKKLKGVMLIPVLSDFMDGPVLHEFMHIWGGGDVIPTAFDSHWGFSSVFGLLGGFDREELKEVGNGLYTAGRFSVGGYADNYLPYAPLELYLAGWIPASEVPDTLIAENASMDAFPPVRSTSPHLNHLLFSFHYWLQRLMAADPSCFYSTCSRNGSTISGPDGIRGPGPNLSDEFETPA